MDITSHVCKEEKKRAEKDRKLERKVEERRDMRWDEERGFWERWTVRGLCTREIFFCKRALFWNLVMRKLTWENLLWKLVWFFFCAVYIYICYNDIKIQTSFSEIQPIIEVNRYTINVHAGYDLKCRQQPGQKKYTKRTLLCSCWVLIL